MIQSLSPLLWLTSALHIAQACASMLWIHLVILRLQGMWLSVIKYIYLLFVLQVLWYEFDMW